MNDAIIVSDLHLGAHNSQSQSILDFLENVNALTKKLIINGDLFDSYTAILTKKECKIIHLLNELSKQMEVIWIKGNHDSYRESRFISPLICSEFHPVHYIFESGNKRILVIHGDFFDSFLTEHPIITMVSDWIYFILQKVNCNLAKKAKHKSKQYVLCDQVISEEAVIYAERLNCQYAICGHTHMAVEKDNYFNSGCWTEQPCSYLAVANGEIKLKLI